MVDIEPPTLGNCTCDNICPGSPDCTCIWYEHLAACVCSCAPTSVVEELDEKVDLYARIHVTARDMPLWRLAQQLSSTCDAELLVPAGRIDEKVSLAPQWLTMGALIEKVGLVARA
jgi:hypothetical protein